MPQTKPKGSFDQPSNDRPRVSRAQKTREVQTAITNSALELLATNGVDGLALTKIAANAGMSNGPLYGRYDSAEDVALELWEEKLSSQFTRLVQEFDAFASSPGVDPSEWLGQELAQPSVLTRGAIEIIAVARRFPLLVDSVRNDVEALFHQICAAHPETPPSICTLRLTLPTGAVLNSGSSSLPRPAWRSSLFRFRTCTLDPANHNQRGRTAPPTILSVPRPDTGDLGLDEFVTAVMEVVARVGFEKTTAHRVARAASHSFSSAYTHVNSKDELMHLAISQMIMQIWKTGTASMIELNADEYMDAIIALQLGLMDDVNRAGRQLRIETTVAMRHHPDLAAAGRERKAASVAIITDALGGVDSASSNDAAGYWYLTSANGIGVVALSLLTTAFRDLDWSPVAAATYQMALESTLEPLRKLAKA